MRRFSSIVIQLTPAAEVLVAALRFFHRCLGKMRRETASFRRRMRKLTVGVEANRRVGVDFPL